MLGSENLQKWYAGADAIQVKPKILAEWNANSFSDAYIYGHGDGSFAEVTDIPSATKTVGRFGSPSSKFELLYTNPSESIESTFSATVAGKGKSYKLSFFINTIASGTNPTVPLNITMTAIAISANGIINQHSTSFTALPGDQIHQIIDCPMFSSTTNDDREIIQMQYKFIAYNEMITTPVKLVIDSPRVYGINVNESQSIGYTSTKDLFLDERPGDPYVFRNPNNYNVSPYYLSYNNIPKETGQKCRGYVPDLEAKFKYYISNSTSTQIFAKYAKAFNTNKIVLKVNSFQNVPSAITIKTLDSSGAWSTGKSISSPFNTSSGLAVIYYVDNDWTEEAWENPPLYSDGTIAPTEYKTIYGISIEFTSSVGELHIVEISPRLELDLSQYAISFSITNELSNDSSPTPIGIASANTADISLLNLPDQTTKQQPFDNYAGFLSGLLGKNVIFRVSVEPYGESVGNDTQQISFMYSSSWKVNGLETITVECFDKIKIISESRAPLYYQKAASPLRVVASILDLIGTTDYYYSDITDIDKYAGYTINHFWTIDDTSVLDTIQDILLQYQIAMYVDAYGMIRFKHISQLTDSSVNPISTYKITDVIDGDVKSNIMSFEIEDENTPSSVSVEYTNVVDHKNISIINSTMTDKIETVYHFPNELLGYIKITKEIKADSRSITYDNSNVVESALSSFTGYILINQEIIHFDGKEVVFEVNHSTQYKHVVRSQNEINNWLSYYSSDPNTVSVTIVSGISGQVTLRNITRGCFGSPMSDHPVGTDTSNLIGYNALITSTDNGLQINYRPAPSDTYCFGAYKTSIPDNWYRIFTAAFSIPDNNVFAQNIPVEIGLGIGTNSTGANGIKAGVSIKKYKNKSNIDAYEYSIFIRDGNTTLKSFIIDKTSVIKNKDGTYTKAPITDDGVFLNPYGMNTISAILWSSKNDASAGVDLVSLVINGSVIYFDTSTQMIISTNLFDKKQSTVTLPAVSIGTKTLKGKNFGVYTNGMSPIIINAIQAYQMKSPNDSDQINNLSLISSAINGNLFGMSNKNELESVVHGYKQQDHFPPLGFVAENIGREIKIYDIQYEAAPVMWSMIERNAYRVIITKDKTITAIAKDTSQKSDYLTIPAEAVTVSSIKHNPYYAKVALINSYNIPVYVNYSATGDNGTTASNTIMMMGPVLDGSSKGKVSSSISGGKIQSEVKISSAWIQDESVASSILGYITSSAKMKQHIVTVELFGNPLIEVGDILNVKYTGRNFVESVYVVMSVQQQYESGINTTVTLRRIR